MFCMAAGLRLNITTFHIDKTSPAIQCWACFLSMFKYYYIYSSILFTSISFGRTRFKIIDTTNTTATTFAAKTD